MSAKAPAEAHEKKDSPPEKKPDAKQEKAKETVKESTADTHAKVEGVAGKEMQEVTGKPWQIPFVPSVAMPSLKDAAVATGVVAGIASPPVGVALLGALATKKGYDVARKIPGLSTIDRFARWGLNGGKNALTTTAKTVVSPFAKLGAFAVNTAVIRPANLVLSLGNSIKNTVHDWWTHTPGESKSLVESGIDGVKKVGGLLWSIPKAYLGAFEKHPLRTVFATAVGADIAMATLGYYGAGVSSSTSMVVQAGLKVLEGLAKALNGLGNRLGG